MRWMAVAGNKRTIDEHDMENGKEQNSPVAIVEHDDNRRRQVEAQTTSTGRKEEDKLLGPLLVILANDVNTIFMSSSSVDSTVLYMRKKRQFRTVV